MDNHWIIKLARLFFILFSISLLFSATTAVGATPVVKTVPWVSTNPLIPHDTWSGKQTTLKGTADVQGSNFQYSWDFGDGSPVASGLVTNKYAIEATHTYTGTTGTVFTARLTVQDTGTGETGSKEYYIKIEDKSLPVESNMAIDEGLWYLHKTQLRITSGIPAVDYGDWTVGGNAASGFYGVTALNINAFEVNGHLESGSEDNPYTETVARGMRRLFTWLTTDGSLSTSQTNGLGTFNPDSNGNGYGIFVNQSYPYYQGGMFMDAIIASGTQDAITTTGQGPSGANPGVIGRSYREIIQDMVDGYAWAQYDYSPAGGGWRYNSNEWPDNSSCQWAAIGLIPAERVWGRTVPQIVKDWNRVWLNYSQNPSTGVFGYTDINPIWGPYATTPSGMVQMAMDGIGRGAPGAPSWDKAETFMRNNFCNEGGPYNAIKDYYYGLFSFVKSLLLHDSNGDKIAEPIKFLQSQTPGVAPIDWYAAEASAGAPCDGIARVLINDQNSAGYWSGHNNDGNQYPFETAQAIIMLNRTIFEAGAPVAVAKATPNPGVAGGTISLDGSTSYHQDQSKAIVSWQWDLNNDGTFELTGPVVATSFAAVGDYPVRLRVTDNSVQPNSAETVVIVRITIPPIAPTANAGGPYLFCTGQNWFLNGSKTVNPDEGKSEPGQPGDTIYGVNGFAWDLNGDGIFADAFGVNPNVTNRWNSGAYLVQLRVTDTTATSFPSSGLGNLSSTSSAQVIVRAATDPACSCVNNLMARPKLNKVQLTWNYGGAWDHFNIYRGTISGGPYLKVGATNSTYSTYLDQTVTVGSTYYYVIRPAALNDNELCQSNEASVKLSTR